MDVMDYEARYTTVDSLKKKEVLFKEALDLENVDRGLFARKRESWHVPELEDPYKTLIPCFRSSIFPGKVFEETSTMLFKEKELKPVQVVESLAVFEEQFLNYFCEGMLRDLCWDHVVAAGGAVAGCLQKIPPENSHNSYTKRKYLHDDAFPVSC